jgi:uncharacterized protein
MKNFPYYLLLVLVAGGLYVFGSYISSNQGVSHRTITVEGVGKATVAPDMAELTVGVQTGRQKSAAEAMKVLNEKIAQIVDKVTVAGVEKKDITTEYLWLNPAYDYTDGRQQDAGYDASQNVKITIRDVAKVSAVLDAAVAAGANQVQNVQFRISDGNTSKDDARKEAITHAQTKANDLAMQLGVRLGKVMNFSESGAYDPVYPVPMYDRAEGGGGGSVVPEGEQTLQSNVTITYEIL